MSGQVIVVIAFEALQMAGFSIAAQGGILSARELVDASVNKAREEIRQHAAKVAQWERYQQKQNEQLAEIRAVYSKISDALKQLAETEISLVAPSAAEETPSNGPREKAKGFVKEKLFKEEQAKVASLMNEIALLLEEMPEPFRKHADSPYPRLIDRQKQLHKKLKSKAGLEMEEAVSFRETLLRSLESYMTSLSFLEKNREELFQKTESLFSDVLAYGKLAQNPDTLKEIQALKSSLLKLIGSKQPEASAIEVLEKKLKDIKGSVEKELEYAARRKMLSLALATQLNEMGYETAEAFPEELQASELKAAFSIPGGERLMVGVQRNNKIAFEVVHESGKPEGELSSRELAKFRKQESRWCEDIPELIRRLTKQGCTCNVSLKRDVPEDAIPITVVESADEIIADEEERERFYDEPEKRKFQ
jgi:hypothetical protein